MKIAILETGAPPEPLAARFGSYPDMFERLLKQTGLKFEAETFDVRAGRFPASPDVFEGCLITGSSAGVYDPLPWIGPLKDFLRAAKGRTRLVGICFGHQIMAEAFGGRAEKSDRGWGIGLQTYAVRERRSFIDGPARVSAPASHQDQVTVVPPGARAVGGDAFCPNGLIAYDDQPAFSVQLHPEFHPAYASALIEARLGSRFDERAGRAAMETLKGADDRLAIGAWIRRFLEA